MVVCGNTCVEQLAAGVGFSPCLVKAAKPGDDVENLEASWLNTLSLSPEECMLFMKTETWLWAWWGQCDPCPWFQSIGVFILVYGPVSVPFSVF